ncbi:MAG: hypothetical protein K6T26_02995 [Alicyclobacillus sp.]|nr:hypothetical protein [Alicyclobacillus sp.]
MSKVLRGARAATGQSGVPVPVPDILAEVWWGANEASASLQVPRTGGEDDCDKAASGEPAEELAANPGTVAGLPGSHTSPAEAVETALRAAWQQAQAILADAQRQADALKAAAQADLAAAFAEARAAGFAAGEQAGREQAAAELAAVTAQVRQTYEQLWRETALQRAQWLEGLKTAVADLCEVALQRLLHRELALQPADVAALVDELFQRAQACTRVQVRVHPDDYAAVLAAQPRWQSEHGSEWELAVVPDPQVEPGGCELWTDVGRMDARLPTRVELLQPVLRSVLAQEVQSLGEREEHEVGGGAA